MKCLLIGGERDTGKTATIRNIVDWLEYCGFYLNNIVDTSNIGNKLGNKEDKVDFFCTAEKDDFKVIISTASDIEKVIKNFEEYYNKYKKNSGFIIAPIRNKNEEGGKLYDCSKEVISNILNIEENCFEAKIFEVDIIKDSNKKFNVNPKNIAITTITSNVFKIQLTEKFERSKEYKYKTAFQVYMATRVSINLLSYWLTSCNLLQEDFFN